MLTAVVIAKNEEQQIRDCLKSLSFADELIVIDNNSIDKTAQTARKFTSKIYSTPLSGWDNLHNFALKKASGDWIFFLDADERATIPLQKKIVKSINSSKFKAYLIRRQNIYLGKPMKFGGWGDDKVIRLLKKSHLIGYEGNLHEQPKFKGELGTIDESIVHYSHRDLYSMTEKTILFTGFEAQNRFDTNHPPVVWWRFIRVMWTEFYLRFVKLSAWRDGVEGIIDGIFQVFNSFIIYSRLWELQNEKKGANL